MCVDIRLNHHNLRIALSITSITTTTRKQQQAAPYVPYRLVTYLCGGNSDSPVITRGIWVKKGVLSGSGGGHPRSVACHQLVADVVCSLSLFGGTEVTTGLACRLLLQDYSWRILRRLTRTIMRTRKGLRTPHCRSRDNDEGGNGCTLLLSKAERPSSRSFRRKAYVRWQTWQCICCSQSW